MTDYEYRVVTKALEEGQTLNFYYEDDQDVFDITILDFPVTIILPDKEDVVMEEYNFLVDKAPDIEEYLIIQRRPKSEWEQVEYDYAS